MMSPFKCWLSITAGALLGCIILSVMGLGFRLDIVISQSGWAAMYMALVHFGMVGRDVARMREGK